MKKLLSTVILCLSAGYAFASPVTVSLTNQFDGSVNRNDIPRSGFSSNNVENYTNTLSSGTISHNYSKPKNITFLLYMSPAAMKKAEFSDCPVFNSDKCNAVYCYTNPVATGDFKITELQIGIKQSDGVYHVSCRVNQQ